MNDLEGDLIGLNLFDGLDDGLDRALGIGFDNHLKDFGTGRGELGKKIFEGHFGVRGLLSKRFGLLRALLGEIARGFFVLYDAEFQAGFGHAVEAQNLDGNGGSGFLLAFPFLIDQRADTAIILAANDDIAHAQGSFANQDRGRRTARLQAGFNDVAFGAAVRIGLQFQQVRLEQNHLDQFVHALLGER